MDYNIQITHKILEKDHTQMEVDSSLSAIECQIKNIYLPLQMGLFPEKLVLSYHLMLIFSAMSFSTASQSLMYY